MKQIMRKMNLSIITCVLVLVLNVTTTFAWAGLQNYSTIENFDVSVEQSENYQLMVSLNGTSFSEFVNDYNVKLKIAYNMGFNENGLVFSDKELYNFLKKSELQPLTTKRIGNELGPFVSIEEIRKNDFDYSKAKETKEIKRGYYTFDIYVTVDYRGENKNQVILDEYQEVYVRDIYELLIGNKKTYDLNKKYVLPSYFDGAELSKVTINSANAIRVAFTKHEVKDINDVTASVPTSTIIYQGGTKKPSLVDGVYSFGGFMDAPNNLAFNEFNDIHSNFPISQTVFEEFYNNRTIDGVEDSISIEDTDGVKFKLIDKSDKLSVGKMMKITIKMWIEGFDGDCFEGISSLPVGMNLILSHFNMK